jgi:peroxiredoxin
MEMATITPGTKVPDFSLPMTGGGTWSLKEAARKNLVIYFYPRDMTSGCTREAGDFRDLQAAFRKAERSTFLLDGSGRLRQEWSQGESARSCGGSP